MSLPCRWKQPGARAARAPSIKFFPVMPSATAASDEVTYVSLVKNGEIYLVHHLGLAIAILKDELPSVCLQESCNLSIHPFISAHVDHVPVDGVEVNVTSGSSTSAVSTPTHHVRKKKKRRKGWDKFNTHLPSSCTYDYYFEASADTDTLEESHSKRAPSGWDKQNVRTQFFDISSSMSENGQCADHAGQGTSGESPDNLDPGSNAQTCFVPDRIPSTVGGPGDATPPSSFLYLPGVDVPCVTHRTMDRICNDFRGGVPVPGFRDIATSEAYTETTAPCFHMDSPFIKDLQARIESFQRTLALERSRYEAIVRDVVNTAAEKNALLSTVEDLRASAESSFADSLSLEVQLGEQEEKLEKLKNYKEFLLRTLFFQSGDESKLAELAEEVALVTHERDRAYEERATLSLTVVELDKRLKQRDAEYASL